METKLEKGKRLLRGEIDTLNKLIEKKNELERLIKHQEKNVKEKEEILTNLIETK